MHVHFEVSIVSLNLFYLFPIVWTAVHLPSVTHPTSSRAAGAQINGFNGDAFEGLCLFIFSELTFFLINKIVKFKQIYLNQFM